jgi:hypothetical protein
MAPSLAASSMELASVYKGIEEEGWCQGGEVEQTESSFLGRADVYNDGFFT